MKVLYVRTSTIEQKTDRQRVNEKDFQLVIEDKCSGAINLFEREGGRQLLRLIEKEALTELYVWQIDRLGQYIQSIGKDSHILQTAVDIHNCYQSQWFHLSHFYIRGIRICHLILSYCSLTINMAVLKINRVILN